MAQKRNMKLLLAALAISCVAEGLAFALFPVLMLSLLKEMSKRSVADLRLAGICALALACVLCGLSMLLP